MPSIDKQVRRFLARVDIDDANVEAQRHSRLVLAHVSSERIRAISWIRSGDDFGGQDTLLLLYRLEVWMGTLVSLAFKAYRSARTRFLRAAENAPTA